MVNAAVPYLVRLCRPPLVLPGVATRRPRPGHPPVRVEERGASC